MPTPQLKQITDIFNGGDDFSNAAQKYTYDAIIKEITGAVNSSTPPDIIYIGVGVGNPASSYPGTNSTINDKVSDSLYDLQCFPAFLNKYNNPLCICINSSLNLDGKPFKDKTRIITEGFPLSNTSNIDLTSLQGKIDMPVVVLNAVSQNDYPGIGNLAKSLSNLSNKPFGAIYLKSYTEINLGSITGYCQFLPKKSKVLQGTISLDLKDEDLLIKLNKDLES